MTDALTPMRFWQLLQRRRLLLVACAGSAALSAAGLSLLIDPLYESKVQFYVSEAPDPAPSAGGLAAQARSMLPGGGDGAIGAYVPMLQSMAVRKLVVEQVREREAKPLGDFVDVTVAKKTTLQVRVLDRDPKVAQRLADAYPLALERFTGELAARRREATLQALATQRKELLQQAGDTRERLAKFLGSRKTSSVQRDQDIVMARWQQLQGELSALLGRVGAVDQRVAVINAQISDELVASAGQPQLTNPLLARLARDIADHEVELAAALAEFDGEQGARHPKVRVIRARLAEKREQFEREAALASGGVAPPDTLREQMRRELLELQRQRASARAESEAKRREMDGLRGGLEKEQSPRLEEQRLVQELEAIRRQADALTQRMADLQTQVLRRDRSVVVLNDGELAERPKFPLPAWNALIAAVLGLIAGIYIALLSTLSGQARAGSAATDGRSAGGQS